MRNRVVTALVLLFAFASLNALTYVLMLEDHGYVSLTDGHAYELRILSYRYGGHEVATFFAPAHWLDRKIRPDYWVIDEGPLYWPTGKKFKLSVEAKALSKQGESCEVECFSSAP